MSQNADERNDSALMALLIVAQKWRNNLSCRQFEQVENNFTEYCGIKPVLNSCPSKTSFNCPDWGSLCQCDRKP